MGGPRTAAVSIASPLNTDEPFRLKALRLLHCLTVFVSDTIFGTCAALSRNVDGYALPKRSLVFVDF